MDNLLTLQAEKKRIVMGKKLTRYSEEFRIEAVRLAEASPKKLKEIAKELGIGFSTLMKWKARYSTSSAPRKPARDEPKINSEVEALKKENERLRKENEILKKATAFFAKDHL